MDFGGFQFNRFKNTLLPDCVRYYQIAYVITRLHLWASETAKTPKFSGGCSIATEMHYILPKTCWVIVVLESLSEAQNAPFFPKKILGASPPSPRHPGASPQTPTATSAAQAPPQSQGLGEKFLGYMKK